MHNLFAEITLILVASGILAAILSILKQPPLIAYILTGIMVGPLGYYGLQNSETFRGLAEIGVTLLLFLIGLELDIREVRKLGRPIFIVGIGQILFSTLIGFGAAQILGWNLWAALIVGFATSLSSTVVAIKLLADKHESQSLYGRLALGMLLLQDIAAVLVIVIIQQSTSTDLTFWPILWVFVKAAILLFAVWLPAKFVFPYVLKWFGKSDELLFLFSLGWALGLATIVSLPQVGFSLEVGGFLAGLALAASPIKYEIGHRVKSLRDFFIILFFIILGAKTSFTHWREIIWPILGLSTLVILTKPVITLVGLATQKFKSKTSLQAGLTIGQMSEFSIVIGTTAMAAGYINQSTLSVLAGTTIVTFIVSSYLIRQSHWLLPRLRWLRNLVKLPTSDLEYANFGMSKHIVIIGAHTMGRSLVKALAHNKDKFIVIDHDPNIVRDMHEAGHQAICGDGLDSHLHTLVNLSRSRLVISTLPELSTNIALAQIIQRLGRNRPKLICTADDEVELEQLYANSVDYALLPHLAGGRHLAHLINQPMPGRTMQHLRLEQLHHHKL